MTEPSEHTESNRDREEKARRLAKETEGAAIELAEQRGREAAKLEAKLAEHDRQLVIVDGSIEHAARGLDKLERTVATLASDFKTNAAIMAARAEDAKAAAERGVTNRTLFITAGLLLAAIAGLFLGGHP